MPHTEQRQPVTEQGRNSSWKLGVGILATAAAIVTVYHVTDADKPATAEFVGVAEPSATPTAGPVVQDTSPAPSQESVHKTVAKASKSKVFHDIYSAPTYWAEYASTTAVGSDGLGVTYQVGDNYNGGTAIQVIPGGLNGKTPYEKNGNIMLSTIFECVNGKLVDIGTGLRVEETFPDATACNDNILTKSDITDDRLPSLHETFDY